MNSTLKSLLFWMVLVFVGLLVWNFSRTFQSREQAMSFSTFMSQVEAGQVSSVTITGNDISGVLKSNETFARLMDELTGTENRLATERMRYNERLQEYNTLRRRFPSNITAAIFGFKEYPYFDAPPETAVPPKVDFSR